MKKQAIALAAALALILALTGCAKDAEPATATATTTSAITENEVTTTTTTTDAATTGSAAVKSTATLCSVPASTRRTTSTSRRTTTPTQPVGAPLSPEPQPMVFVSAPIAGQPVAFQGSTAQLRTYGDQQWNEHVAVVTTHAQWEDVYTRDLYGMCEEGEQPGESLLENVQLAMETYDDGYFRDHALLVLMGCRDISKHILAVTDICKANGQLCVTVEYVVLGMSTMQTNSKRLYVEIAKSDLADVDRVVVVERNKYPDD